MTDIIKFLTMAEVVPAVMEHKQTFMMIEINEYTSLGELRDADGFMTVEKKEDPKPEPKKPKAKPKPAPKPGIDHGKIVALYKAGWKIPQIADELGCSQQTVYNHLAKEAQEESEDEPEADSEA